MIPYPRRPYFDYDTAKSISYNIKTAAQRNKYRNNGHVFKSVFHMNAINRTLETRAKNVYKDSRDDGNFHFHSGGIVHEKDEWRSDTTKKHPNAVNINLVDKLKVITASLSIGNAAHYMMAHSLDGVQEKAPRKNREGDAGADMFLQSIIKVSRPAGTVANYKRADFTYAAHAHDMHAESRTVNKTNVNLPKGIHEYIVLNRTCVANVLHSCPEAQAKFILDTKTGNNNSLTTDSVISAVSNGITFKAAASADNEKFVLAPMESFGTHKTMAMCLKKDEKKVVDSEEALRPLEGSVLIVHEHCYNCSAIPGEKLVPIIERKGAELLEEKNTKVSIAVNNAKAYLERSSYSLVYNSLNSLCDLLCWDKNTRNMTREQELEFYRTVCVPILEKIMVTRDNYSQAGSFCQRVAKQVPKTTPLFSAAEMKLVSHKFRNPKTKKMFSKSSPRFPRLMDRVNRLNPKKPLFGQISASTSKKHKYKAAVLSSQPARNEGVIRAFEIGPAVFRERFPFINPSKKDL